MATPSTTVRRSDNPNVGALPNVDRAADFEKPTLSDIDSDSIDSGLDDAGVVDLPAGSQTPDPAPVPDAKLDPAPEPAATGTSEPTGPTGAAEPVTGATGEAVPISPTGTATPVAPAATGPAKDPEVDSIAEPRGMNPANRANWKRLQTLASEAKAAKSYLETEVKTLKEKMAAAPPVPEAITKELEDLRQFRRVWDIQRDPEFDTKFEKAITDNEEDIYKLLTQYGVKEEAIASIRMSEIAGTSIKGTRAISKEWWDTNVLEPLKNSGDPQQEAAADIIADKIKANRMIGFEKEKAIQSASASQSEWIKNREAQTTKQREENIATVKNYVEESIKAVEWVGKKDIPATATPEQKAELEDHNKFVDECEATLKAALNPQNALQRAQAAVSCVLSILQQRRMVGMNADYTALQTSSKAQIDQLTAEITKLKSAGITSKSGKAAPVAGSKAASAVAEVHRQGMKDDAAIDAGLDEAGA